jgi:hypothetical protein
MNSVLHVGRSLLELSGLVPEMSPALRSGSAHLALHVNLGELVQVANRIGSILMP